jgi:hypothetical protein
MRLPSTIRLLAALWLIFPVTSAVHAQVPLPGAIEIFDSGRVYQSVTVSVQDIALISVSGNVTLTISGATPGSSPDDDTDSSTSYALTVNGTGKKLTGALDAAYAGGVTLDALLTAPTGASAVQQTLTTTAKDLVTGIATVAASGLTIAYTASAAPTAAPNGPGVSRTVTFTLTDE